LLTVSLPDAWLSISWTDRLLHDERQGSLCTTEIYDKFIHLIGKGYGGIMEVTEVKIFPVQEDRLKAYATITFDHCFVIRDLKVISGNNGLFVAMPSKKRKDGTYRDTAHPLNNETRQMIESKVLEEYHKEIQKPKNT
jgi:stage V sporulation protein G